MSPLAYARYLATRLRGVFTPPPPPPPDPMDAWRREHPSCVFLGASRLERVRLGRHVSILTGAALVDVEIADYSYVSYGSVLTNASIGRFCSIGAGVQIGLGRHPARDFVSTYPAFYTPGNTGCAVRLRENTIFDESAPRTSVGHDVWIGEKAMVPGGVSIQTGAIVAAGAVVVKDVPPYAIVGGNPAALIRYRFDESVIQRLLESRWWDWPLEEIRRSVDAFSNVEQFLKLRWPSTS